MRVSGILALALSVASLRAGDPPAPASDAIAAARKDFASIKAPAAPPEAGPGIPVIGARDDGAGSAGVRADGPVLLPPPGLAAADPFGKKAGTGNWLVDAMERKPEQPQSSRGKDDPARGGLDHLRDAAGPGKVAQLSESGERAESNVPAGSAYNPLEAFMEGWVSAHDRELLLPARRGDGLLGGDPGGARAGMLPGIDLGPQGSSTGGATAPRDAAPADPDLRPAANPYIADIDPAPIRALPPPDAPVFAPLMLPDLSRGMPPPALDPRSFDAFRPVVPDFAQPADDDKYFKQMKRF